MEIYTDKADEKEIMNMLDEDPEADVYMVRKYGRTEEKHALINKGYERVYRREKYCDGDKIVYETFRQKPIFSDTVTYKETQKPLFNHITHVEDVAAAFKKFAEVDGTCCATLTPTFRNGDMVGVHIDFHTENDRLAKYGIDKIIDMKNAKHLNYIHLE